MADKNPKQLQDILDAFNTLPEDSEELLRRAYQFAKRAHRGQKRFSGKAYLAHVAATAKYLAELGMDPETVAAGLLHDVIEDTEAAKDEVEKEFGEEILALVQGVTKLGQLKYQGLERHTESLRKLFVAMAQDIRVLIIKLADRLHNMRTLEHVPAEKQKRIALETLEIYAPLAHRLGIGKLKGELEDLAFPFAYPDEYEEVKKLHEEKSKDAVRRLEKISRSVRRRLAEKDIAVTTLDKRVKHLYSFFRKLGRYNKNDEAIYDIAALRIIVLSVEDCYRALGIIHDKWRPLPRRIKDYIATPKPNGYQSLHTTIFTGDGGIVEIQIRTSEMHQEAEFGIASHVAYKEGGVHDIASILATLSPFTDHRADEADSEIATQAPAWIKQLAELQRSTENPQEFLKNLKTDFFDDRVFVFTPKGEVVDLPVGATPIDFAYAIHTDLGNHLSGTKINGKFTSIDTELHSGDIVEIETSKQSKPRRKWLESVKTTLAKRRIRGALRKRSK